MATAELAGRAAVVTGASKGIGRAIARRLAQDRCRLALVARSADELDKAVLETPEKICWRVVEHFNPKGASVSDSKTRDSVAAISRAAGEG